MHSASEGFRPVGHKAPTLCDVVLPEETFQPIQRVVDMSITDRDKTIGYLFREVYCMNGKIADIVLSEGILCGGQGRFKLDCDDWRKYEKDERINPRGWKVMSGPTMMELMYRSSVETTELAQEINDTWIRTLNGQLGLLQTSTVISYNSVYSVIRHNWNKNRTRVPQTLFDVLALADDNGPEINQLLRGLLGNRYAAAKGLFERFGASGTQLCSGIDEGACTFALSMTNDNYCRMGFSLYNNERKVRGISSLANFPWPHFLVRDE